MNFFYSALIVAGLISGSACAMDSQPENVDTVLELVWRSSYLDLDFDSLCSWARVRKNIRQLINLVNTMKEREKVLEDDYNKRLKRKDYDRGALLTLRKDRLAYGFIGVKVLSEESCGGEHCQLWLQWVKFRKCEDIALSSPSSHGVTIVTTWGDPEPITEKYPWIENFKNPEQRPLRYVSVGNSTWDGPVSINKPHFRPDGSLCVSVETYILRQFITDLFSTINKKREFTVNDDGVTCSIIKK
jgi:hypothetical protein